MAGVLLTFIPAAGDFINAQLLGTPKQFMIGNVIQSRYLVVNDYPTAAALSFLLMAFMLIIVIIWARIAGTEALLGTEGSARCTAGATAAAASTWAAQRYAALALIYLLVPIAVIIVFSFNDPRGASTSSGTSSASTPGSTRSPCPGVGDALITSIEIAALSTLVATVLGTLTALALVRYEFKGPRAGQLLHLHPAGHAGGGARAPRCSRSSSTGARRSSASRRS